MKVKIQILFFSLILILGVGKKAFSQLDISKKLNQFTLETWTVQDGLPSSTLIDIHQSKDGYIWITSFQGLIRFDGKDFKVFDKSNVDVLLTNSVICISEDSDGTLWLGSEGSGLISYKDGKFTSHKQDEFHYYIKSVLIDKHKKQIWIGTTNKGLYLYDFKNFRKINYEPLNDVTVISLAQDKDGVVWASTEGNGICKLKGEKWENFTEKEGLLDNDGIQLFFDWQNTLWVSTISGLCSYDGNNFKTIPELKGFEINSVIKDVNDNLLVATQNGLCRIQSITGEVEWLQEKDGLPNQELDDLIFDTEGNLWTVTYRGGLCKLKNGKFINYNEKDGLSTKAISIIHEYENGKYLVGCNYGQIDIIENDKISQFHFKTPLIKDRIFGINHDHKKNLWVSTYGGLLRIKPNGKERLFSKKDGLPSNKIMLTYTDKNGTIWVGTRTGGLLRLTEPENDYAIPFDVFDQKNGLNSNFIMSIDEDLDGNLVVGTNTGGINIIYQNDEIKQYTRNEGLISNLIFNTYTDKDGVTWIVTNGGLSRFQNEVFFNFSTSEGLPNDSPFDFIEDKSGYCWMPSSIGLIRVNKEELNDFAKGKINKINWKVLDKNDGMNQSECTGATQALKASDGSIWVPTFDGISRIKPNFLHLNTIKPPVYIESLAADGKLLNIKENVEIDAAVHRLVLEFTAISYSASLKNQFKYKLENFDEDWVTAGNAHQAIYTKLEPNTYTFRVIGSNNDGVWNMDGASLEFEVLPVWWLTLWAKTLWVIILLTAIIFFYLWRVSRLNKQKTKLEFEVKIRTSEILQQKEEMEIQAEKLKASNNKLIKLDRFKEAMTGMIVHDLKNPLNTIISFSENNPSELRIKKIHEAGKLILNMTYNMLDIQKFEEAKTKINKTPHAISELIEDAIDQVTFLKEDKALILTTNYPENIYVLIDYELILRTLINILTNAIKYTEPNGKIHIEVKSDKDQLKVLISDTGIGIPEDKLHLVFNKYAQIEAKESGNVRSTGLGLTFCKLVIEAHECKIGVNSEIGKGSSFWFTLNTTDKLPVKKTITKDKSIDTYPSHDIRLNPNEKESLEPLIKKLQKWEVFDFSEVNEILMDIDSGNHPAIDAWLKEMKKALLNMNQKKYKELTEL